MKKAEVVKNGNVNLDPIKINKDCDTNIQIKSLMAYVELFKKRAELYESESKFFQVKLHETIECLKGEMKQKTESNRQLNKLREDIQQFKEAVENEEIILHSNTDEESAGYYFEKLIRNI